MLRLDAWSGKPGASRPLIVVQDLGSVGPGDADDGGGVDGRTELDLRRAAHVLESWSPPTAPRRNRSSPRRVPRPARDKGPAVGTDRWPEERGDTAFRGPGTARNRAGVEEERGTAGSRVPLARRSDATGRTGQSGRHLARWPGCSRGASGRQGPPAPGGSRVFEFRAMHSGGASAEPRDRRGHGSTRTPGRSRLESPRGFGRALGRRAYGSSRWSWPMISPRVVWPAEVIAPKIS